MEKIKAITIGIVVALTVILLLTLPSILCPTFCPQKATIEGVITQNGKPINNVNTIINGHNAVTGTDGKYVISDIKVEQNMTFDVLLPPIPTIGYDSLYYLGIEPEKMFQKQLSDDYFREISIYFKLTEEEANKDLMLFLDTLYGTHESGGKKVPHFKMNVKIRPLKEDWSDLGEYTFGDSPNVCEKEIKIDYRFIDSGENIILFEAANPRGEGYWVFFDSLKLEVIGGHTIWTLGINDRTADEFFNPWKINCMHE